MISFRSSRRLLVWCLWLCGAASIAPVVWAAPQAKLDREPIAEADIAAKLVSLHRKLSIAVVNQSLADAQPNLELDEVLQLRAQGLALWATAPDLSARRHVLQKLERWGLLGRLPGWNPNAGLPSLGRPLLPPAPDKQRMEANQLLQNLEQPLVVHFWAAWCGPCREELPQLARFYAEQYLALQAAGIGLVTVNNDPSFDPSTEAELVKMVRQLPVLKDPDFRLYRRLAQRHDVALPATFLLRPDRSRRTLAYGPMRWLEPGLTEDLRTVAQVDEHEPTEVSP